MTSPEAPTLEERIAALKAAVAELDREDVQRISLPLPDDARLAALGRAVEAAERAGRSGELAKMRGILRHEAVVRWNRALLRPTWLGLNWGVSSGTSEDRVAIAAAFDEAAVLAITEDLIDEDDRDVLGWAPAVLLGSAAHAGDSGSLAYQVRSTPARGVVAAAAVGAAIVTGAALVAAPIVALAAALARRRRSPE